MVLNGPAQRAGLRGPQEVTIRRGSFIYRGLDRSKADLIVPVDGHAVRTLDDLLTYVESKKPGDTVVLTVLREGRSRRLRWSWRRRGADGFPSRHAL